MLQLFKIESSNMIKTLLIQQNNKIVQKFLNNNKEKYILCISTEDDDGTQEINWMLTKGSNKKYKIYYMPVFADITTWKHIASEEKKISKMEFVERVRFTANMLNMYTKQALYNL